MKNPRAKGTATPSSDHSEITEEKRRKRLTFEAYSVNGSQTSLNRRLIEEFRPPCTVVDGGVDAGVRLPAGIGLPPMEGFREKGSSICKHAAYPDLDASTSFFGVYDGHGGKVVAKICAKYLHQQVLKNEVFAAGDIGTSVQRAFLRMDEVMYGQIGWRELAILGDKFNKFTGMIEGLIWSPRSGNSSDQVDNWAFKEGPHSDFSGPTSGCTACVAVLRNKQLVVANAGDSLCVISRNGQAYNLSRDHKPDLEVEKERILKAGGFIHGGRVNVCLNLARAIGDIEFKQNKFLPAEKQIVTANPDVNTVELCDDDDFLVLACDGIWDCMSSQKLVDFIHEQLHSESKLSTVCERVLDKCLAPSTATGEGCDNMTMVLVQFKKPIKSVSSSMDDSKSFDTESKQEGNQE
ncbi:probable protein phosphatase 2C 60 [Hibiscus syriacus]|uniref:probable protein phosphatase 2C 60 n=1 Tax=Hibiscus syriacus TaxID=106335 RepID=UPI001920B63C|nr:probable protein phosphatase 2C 60 [Hibiscus syriacus]